jgi:hypothetical protein
MKTFTQFNEDIEQRRKQLRQRQLDQMAANKERVASYQDVQKRKQEKQREREQIKKEIKRELQTEQTPTMKPNYYSQQVARRQAAQKTAQIRHVHQELGAEARAQQAAKRERLKSLMSK